MSRAIVAVFSITLAALAQDPGQDPNAKEMQAIFTSKVNLVMVPVVVRDKGGKTIGTLKKENFQLFDKGRPQVIERFLIEKASDRLKPIEIEKDVPADPAEAAKPAAAGVPAASFLAYFFDDTHIDAGDLNEVRNAALKHLAESMRPDERVAVYTTSGKGMLDFTDDREKIRGAMMGISARMRTDSRECPPMSYFQADQIITANDLNAFNVAVQDAFICANLNGQTVNGTQVDLLTAQNMTRSTASRVLQQGIHDARTALTVLKDMARRMASSPGERTMVLISPGFFVNDDIHNDEMEVIDRAIRAGVIISAIDARGLVARGPGGDVSDDRFNQSNSPINEANREQVLKMERLTASHVLEDLSSGTGGVLFENSNDFEEGLRRATQPPEFMYMLGFSPQNLKLDGKFHELKVTLNIKDGSTLVARRGYYAPKHAANEAELAQDELREAVFSREELQEIPLELQTQFFKADDGSIKLGLVTKIDLKALHFRKEQGLNKNTLTIVAALFDHNGNIVTGAERKLAMNLKDATFEERVGTPVSVKIPLNVTPGSYVVRVILRDQEGNQMTARNRAVEIPY
jgi:VWFA-related protein